MKSLKATATFAAQLLLGIYGLGVAISAPYLFWTSAKQDSFANWFFLGQIVATAEAFVWPYRLMHEYNANPSAKAASQAAPSDSAALGVLPDSIGRFTQAIDALARANERPAGITAKENVLRVTRIFKSVVNSAKTQDRQELNALYPELGDHFTDEALRHMQLMMKAMDLDLPKDEHGEAMTQALGSYVAWNRWWERNAAAVSHRIVERYAP